MNYEHLEQNIIDIIKEEQVKLGYRSERIRLYYPLLSLNRFLEADLDREGMMNALADFGDFVRDRLGNLEFSCKNDRFCIEIPPEGTDYVHENTKENEFIRDFVDVIAKHGTSLDDILQQFYHYSDHVHVEKMDHGEFDYLVYFEDGQPDPYYYCITDEGVHMIYHRFTKEDYRDTYAS